MVEDLKEELRTADREGKGDSTLQGGFQAEDKCVTLGSLDQRSDLAKEYLRNFGDLFVVDKSKSHNDDAYLKMKIQPIDVIFSMEIGKDYCLGNIIKYAMRYRYKGQAMSDLKKLDTYLHWLTELEEGEKD